MTDAASVSGLAGIGRLPSVAGLRQSLAAEASRSRLVGSKKDLV
jgi:hypothetical protein